MTKDTLNKMLIGSNVTVCKKNCTYFFLFLFHFLEKNIHYEEMAL